MEEFLKTIHNKSIEEIRDWLEAEKVEYELAEDRIIFPLPIEHGGMTWLKGKEPKYFGFGSENNAFSEVYWMIYFNDKGPTYIETTAVN